MRTVIAFILICVTASLHAQQYNGDTWSSVKSSGTGTISIAYVETPSFVYKDQSGQLTGICIDIMSDFVTWVNDTKGVKVTSKLVGDGSSFKVCTKK